AFRRFSFFFSSRRRHTRSKRDWSSDVCSSDLVGRVGAHATLVAVGRHLALDVEVVQQHELAGQAVMVGRRLLGEQAQRRVAVTRSEERRVGKEWRSWWAREEW